MKKFFLIYFIFITIFIAYLIFLKPANKTASIEKFFPSNDSSEAQSKFIDSILNSLSLKEKVAQLIFPFGYSEFLNEESEKYKQLIKQVKIHKVGGFVFLTGDILSQALLINDMQKNSQLPLLVCADFEQGLGFRLKDAVEFPTAMAFSAANDDTLTYLAAKAISEQSEAFKVNVVFAPVLDVNVESNNPIINIRAFSDDPEIVVKHGVAFVKGLQENKIVSVAKHFPGHGMTFIDSHVDLPKVKISYEELKKKHIRSFKEAIDYGAAGIMTAHIIYEGDGIKSDLPATMSDFFIDELLVKNYEFKGLIFTDALRMSAITNYFSPYEAAKLAINAGANILLMPPENETLIDFLVEGVKTKEIQEEKVNLSNRKILEFKYKLNLFNERFIDFDNLKKVLNRKSHFRLAKEVAEKSITLIKNKNILPILNDRKKSIALIIIGNRKFASRIPFERELKKKFRINGVKYVESTSNELDFEKTLQLSNSANYVIIGHFTGYEPPKTKSLTFLQHKELTQKILKQNNNSTIVIFGNPYWASEYQKAGAIILTYSGSESSQIAAAKAISGENDIQGILPIEISGISLRRGEGIFYKSNILIDEHKESINYYDFGKIDETINKAIADSVFPGSVLLIGKENKVIYKKAFGNFSYAKNSPKMEINTIFDLASVTKVVATTSAALILNQLGKFDVEDYVFKYVPEFEIEDKKEIKIKHLLTHQSGLKPFIPFYKFNFNKKQIIDSIAKSSLDFKVGENYQYSDLNMIILQEIIERIEKKNLSEVCFERIFKPLEMNRTFFNPPAELKSECAPTEKDDYWRMKAIQGEVHDENAHLLKGIAGHAGLFSTCEDLAKFCFTILNDGVYKNVQIFNSTILSEWIVKKSESGSRAFGWAVKSENSFFGDKASRTAIGHTGFTGTSIIIDKEKKIFIIFLTNRVHPSRKNAKIINFRPKLFNLIYDIISY